MPYENEHAARIKDPDLFMEGDENWGSKDITTGIRIILGRLKSDGKWEAQAYRFKSDKFTVSEAKKWLKDHDIKYISFEPATGEEKSFETNIERRYLIPEQLLIEERGEGEVKMPFLAGYAAVFNTLSEPLCGFREKIETGAFKESIEQDDIRALVDHDSSKILGRNKAKTLILREDDKGLFVEIQLPDTTTGRDIAKSIKRGDISQMSFGFKTISDEWYKEDEQDIRTLKKVKLFDVSTVTFPAYPDTTVAVRSLEQWKQSQIKLEENNLDILRRKIDIIEKE